MKQTICNNKKQLIKKIESGQDSLINPVANCYVFNNKNVVVFDYNHCNWKKTPAEEETALLERREILFYQAKYILVWTLKCHIWP